MQRESRIVWEGTLKKGKGTLSTESGALKDTPYTFVSRFEQGSETNPEELIGAAHGGCFSMALALELEKAGMTPERIETTARVSLDQVDGKWTIDSVHLSTKIRSSGADQDAVSQAAGRAKENCPVSRLLNAKITLDTELEEARAA